MEGITPEEQNPEEKKDWFEEQWAHPQSVQVAGEEKPFDVYDIKPEGEAKTETPLIIGMGWGAIPKSDKEHIKYWTEHGRRVIVSDTPHGISAEDSEHKEKYPTIEIEKMTALIETLKSKGIEIKEDGTASGQVDLMGRSEGAIFSIMLAYLYPQLIRSLILENPAGLTGKINPGIFAMRWFRLMKQQIRKEYDEDSPQPENHLNEVLGRNLKKAVESVLAISTSDVREMLKEIKANGIGISVIATTDDKFFPIEKLAGKA
jgi:pimeloyl-ACP methyl ester carboxylesterase